MGWTLDALGLDDDAALCVLEWVEVGGRDDAHAGAQGYFVKADRADARAGADDLADFPDAGAGIEKNDDVQGVFSDAAPSFELGKHFVHFGYFVGGLSARVHDALDARPDGGLYVGVGDGLVDQHEDFRASTSGGFYGVGECLSTPASESLGVGGRAGEIEDHGVGVVRPGRLD